MSAILGRFAAAGRALLGIKSPSESPLVAGFREGLASPSRPSDADCVAAMTSLVHASARLKKGRAGEDLTTADVRWIGRDIARALRVLMDHDDRWAAWGASLRTMFDAQPEAATIADEKDGAS